MPCFSIKVLGSRKKGLTRVYIIISERIKSCVTSPQYKFLGRIKASLLKFSDNLWRVYRSRLLVGLLTSQLWPPPLMTATNPSEILAILSVPHVYIYTHYIIISYHIYTSSLEDFREVRTARLDHLANPHKGSPPPTPAAFPSLPPTPHGGKCNDPVQLHCQVQPALRLVQWKPFCTGRRLRGGGGVQIV